MRTIFLVTICLWTIAAMAQPSAQIHLLGYFDRIPVPPSSAQEAYTKLHCRVDGGQTACTPDSLFAPLESELTALNMQIMRKQSQSTAAPSASQQDLAKKMQDPEYQKKIQSMTQEEKIAWAMEMSRGMQQGTQPRSPETPAVLAAINESAALTQSSTRDMQERVQRSADRQKHDADLQARHDAIESWLQGELQKLPSPEEMPEDSPAAKAVKSLRVKAAERHLAVADADLQVQRRAWLADRDSAKARCTPFVNALEATHNGDDAVNPETKAVLLGGESTVLGRVASVTGASKDLYRNAVQWYAQKARLEADRVP